MSSPANDLDLDAALNLEAEYIREGESIGIRRAEVLASEDAVNLGKIYGKELGAELGAFTGNSIGLTSTIRRNTTTLFNPLFLGFLRGVKAMMALMPEAHPAAARVAALENSIQAFPLDKPVDAQGQAKLDKIRSAFKVLESNLACKCSLLVQPSAPSLKGNSDLF